MSRTETKLENLAETATTEEASWAIVRRDLEVLRADVAKLGEKSLAEGQERITQELDRIKANVTDIAQRVGQKSHDSAEVAADYVRKRPFTSVAGAFAIGMVFASLSRRR